MMEVVVRQAGSRDIRAVSRILQPWCKEDPSFEKELPQLLSDTSGRVRCTVFEVDKIIRSATLWVVDSPNRVRLLALGLGAGAAALGANLRVLKEDILEWSGMNISTARIDLPLALAPHLIDVLRNGGFLPEGFATGWEMSGKSSVRLVKHFLYRTIPHSEVMNFLQEVLLSMGYEIRPEADGFRYRIREEFALPFIFSTWHRVVADGPDIIFHPPARALKWHDVEEMFYPLRIYSPDEKPLLLPMDKERAMRVIDLPRPDPRQNSLFNNHHVGKEKIVRLNNIAYCYPIRIQHMRQGLPLMFYVNKVGAVGSARVAEWFLDEPENLHKRMDEIGDIDEEELKEHVAASGPRAGKILVMKFHWYQPFKRAVSLDELRALDDTFNPKRTRSLSSELFHSISSAGNLAD